MRGAKMEEGASEGSCEKIGREGRRERQRTLGEAEKEGGRERETVG